MRWVTRENVRVDRVSSAWMILTFIDPEAELLFAPREDVVAVGEREDAIPFDVPGVEMGHHDDEVAFDAILKKYGPKDPALDKLAMIVRGADSPNKDLTPESRGLDAVANGFKRMAQIEGYGDLEAIRRQWHMYNAFYLFCGGDPSNLKDRMPGS